MVTRLATLNVNGIRATLRRGLRSWLDSCGADVVALQEVRCPERFMPLADLEGWHLVHDAGDKAGRNGVALLSRTRPSASRTSLADAAAAVGSDASRLVEEFGAEGRYVEADHVLGDTPVTVASLYLPKGGLPASGEVGSRRYERKLRFLDGFGDLVRDIRRAREVDGGGYVLLGDVNIASGPGDLYNHHLKRPLEGYLPAERAWLESVVAADTGLVDVVRHLHPEGQGPYSWWSWRTGQFEADNGWRIDLHLASPSLATRAISGGTDRPRSNEARMSDHAPVVVDYDL